tara:strand:+ start:293 stop:466 length:174 start_codon:yes stop_codon:yes gene_type:complete
MQVGDLVLCGLNENLGIIVGWDEDKDPIVWEFKTQGCTAMYRDRVKLADFIITTEAK